MLYFKLYPFTLLKQSRSFTFLFMYLGELLQYYQSSNNLPQSAQTLDFDLKSCFVLLNTSSCSTRCWLASVLLFVALVCLGPWVVLLVVDLSPSQSLLLWFGLLATSSHSTHCRLVSVSLFVALVCLWHQVVLLVVDLSPSQSGSFTQAFEHSTFWASLWIRFEQCVAVFCTFVIAFLKRLPSTQPLHAVAKRTVVDAYKYIYI